MTLNFDSLTHFLQTLIQLQTLSGEERPVIERVAAEMQRLGYDRRLLPGETMAGVVEAIQFGLFTLTT